MLASVLPAAVLVPAASTIVAVALPAIMADLAIGNSAIWWLVTGYLVLVAVLHAPAGRLGDHIGHRRLLLAGTAVLAAAAVGAAVAPGPVALVVARLLQGVGGAAIVPAGLAIIRRRVPADARDRAIGMFMAAMAGGALLGVAGGGILVTGGGWRAAFVTLAGLAVAALAPAVAGAGAGRPAPAPGHDAPSDAPAPPWRQLATPAAGIALTSLTLYVVLLVLPIRLDAAGWSTTAGGMLLAAFVLASAAGALGAARVAATLGRSRATAVAAVTAAGALAVMAATPATMPWLVTTLTVAGGGLGTAVSGLFVIGLGDSRADAAGTTSGLLSTARYVGSITGTAALPPLLDAAGPHAGILLAAVASLAVAPLLWPTSPPRNRTRAGDEPGSGQPRSAASVGADDARRGGRTPDPATREA